MLQLSSEQRRQLRAQAHGLNPVVSIAQQGLSDTVLKEIDNCLKAHELIKIRVYGDDREARETYLATICTDVLQANQLASRAIQRDHQATIARHPSAVRLDHLARQIRVIRRGCCAVVPDGLHSVGCKFAALGLLGFAQRLGLGQAARLRHVFGGR